MQHNDIADNSYRSFTLLCCIQQPLAKPLTILFFSSVYRFNCMPRSLMHLSCNCKPGLHVIWNKNHIFKHNSSDSILTLWYHPSFDSCRRDDSNEWSHHWVESNTAKCENCILSTSILSLMHSQCSGKVRLFKALQASIIAPISGQFR